MALLVYKPSAETAYKVLEFFKMHPNKDYCVVSVGQGREVIYWRKDIPRLKEIDSK